MPSVWAEKRRRKSGHTWRVVWRENGKRRVQDVGPFLSLRDEFICKKREELYALEAGLPPPIVHKTWPEAAASYLNHCKQHKAYGTYRCFDKPAIDMFSEFIGTAYLSAITTEDIVKFEHHLLEKGYKPNGVRIKLRAVRTAFNYFKRDGWVPKGPRFNFPREEEVGRVIPGDDLKRIFEAAPERNVEAYATLLLTGMRIGELLNLETKDVKQDADGTWELEVHTLKRKQGEGSRIRLVPIPPAWADRLRARPGKLFDISRNSLQSCFHDAAKRLGLPRTRIHDLRHTWATRFMEKTGDLYALMRLGGWKDLKSVEKYQHLTRGRSKSILELNFGINPILPPDKPILPL